MGQSYASFRKEENCGTSGRGCIRHFYPSICPRGVAVSGGAASTFFDQEISLPDDDGWAPFEIGIATLAVESQAIFHLLPKDQADRVTVFIYRCIDSPELKGVGKMHFDNYCQSWRASVESAEIPFYGIASLLYDRLGLKSTTNVGSAMVKSPLTLMMLGDIVMRIGNGWWKRFLGEYKLI